MYATHQINGIFPIQRPCKPKAGITRSLSSWFWLHPFWVSIFPLPHILDPRSGPGFLLLLHPACGNALPLCGKPCSPPRVFCKTLVSESWNKHVEMQIPGSNLRPIESQYLQLVLGSRCSTEHL